MCLQLSLQLSYDKDMSFVMRGEVKAGVKNSVLHILTEA